jgi:hypothetical protein
MNVLHLETEQAVEHTKLMVSPHLRKEDEVGRMLQTSIEQLQNQAGSDLVGCPKPTRKEGTNVHQSMLCLSHIMGMIP